jgi:putative FmdB family regulatory protein
MILYEYKCVACGSRVQCMRPMAERNDPAQCPGCGCEARRVITAPQAWKGVWAKPVHPDKLRTTKEIWE